MPSLPSVKRFDAGNGVRIYRIACEVFTYLTARVYLLLEAGVPTLVDTGSGQGESSCQILAGIETVRTEFGETVRPADIRRIVITHGHFDHAAGLWDMLAEMKQAEVAIHPLDSRAITAPDDRAVVGRYRLLNFLRQAGVEESQQAELVGDRYARGGRPSVPVGVALEDGLEFDGLRFVHTPGHAPGHVCTIVGDVLLSGDHLLARTLSQQWPESMIPYTGLGHYLESLEKIGRTGGFDLALAGHEPVIRDVYRRIDAIRDAQFRRLDRLIEVLRAADGPMSIAEIANRMYADKQGFHVMLALTDVGARVEYLHQRGQLTVANLDEIESQQDQVFRYRAV